MIRRFFCALTFHTWRPVFQSGSIKVIGCQYCRKLAMRDYETDEVEIWS